MNDSHIADREGGVENQPANMDTTSAIMHIPVLDNISIEQCPAHSDSKSISKNDSEILSETIYQESS